MNPEEMVLTSVEIRLLPIIHLVDSDIEAYQEMCKAQVAKVLRIQASMTPEKLREEIAGKCYDEFYGAVPWSEVHQPLRDRMLKLADQLLPLIDAQVKAVWEEGFDEGVRKTTDACVSTYEAQLKVERERIRYVALNYPTKTAIQIIDNLDRLCPSGGQCADNTTYKYDGPEYTR